MVLKKYKTRRFRGATGKTATLRLIPRKQKVTVKPIAAVYGDKTVKIYANGSIRVTLVAGTKPFSIVYAYNVAEAWIDVMEVDGGERQKLRGTRFNPANPIVPFWLKGV